MHNFESIPKGTSYFLACIALLVFLFGQGMVSTTVYDAATGKASDMMGDGEAKFYLDWVAFSAAVVACSMGGVHLVYTHKRR